MGALLKPQRKWVWRDAARRGLRLLRFAEVEADGGRDLVRASEVTGDARVFCRSGIDVLVADNVRVGKRERAEAAREEVFA